MPRSLHFTLLLCSVFLCISFCIQFGLSLYEAWTWPEPTFGFAVDAPPQYAIGLYHGLFAFLFASLVYAKQYRFALIVNVGYITFHLYATYIRLCSGFFGGDLCPDGHLTAMAFRRVSLFDWTSTVLIVASFFLLLAILVSRRVGRRYEDDPTPSS